MLAALPVRALLVGAERVEAQALADALRRSGVTVEYWPVADEHDYLAALDVPPDLILAAYSAPDLPAPRALALLQTRGLCIPFVVLAGPDDDAAVELLHQGAADMLFRGHTARLGTVVRRALAGAADDVHYRRLFEASAEALVVVDGQGRIAVLNARAEALFGYGRAELTGQPIEVLLAESDRDGHRAYRAEFAVAPRARPMGAGRSLRARRKDGSLFAAEISLSPLPGLPRGLVAAQVVDLGEGVRVEGHVGAMIGAAPLGICVVDENGTFARVNDAYADLLGYRPGELLGQPFTVILPPEDREEGMTTFWRVLAAGAERVSERTLRRKDGTPVAVLGASIPVSGPEGRPQRATFVVDIEERRQAEEARGRLAAIVDGSSDAIIGLALDRTITSWNAGAERLYGYSAAEAIGRSIAMLAVPGGPDESPQIRDTLLHGEPVVDLETERRHRDGWTLPVSLSASPVRDASGAIIGAAVIHRDISARVRAERQRDLLLASVVHDLKNPLVALVLLGDLLQRQAVRMTEPEGMRILDMFVQSAQQMMLQIDELVDITHIQMRRPLALQLQVVDLAALVERLAAEQAKLSAAHSIKVEGIGDPLPGLYDEARLARALTNVLGNAVKYSAPGGQVTVVLSCEEEATGTWATIRVVDRGIGIPAGELGRLFELYYRASNARRQSEGTGVGLAGARQIVAAHGGTVNLESAEGVGTTVTLRLPHRPPQERPGTTS